MLAMRCQQRREVMIQSTKIHVVIEEVLTQATWADNKGFGLDERFLLTDRAWYDSILKSQ